ncbi:MAG: RHS repeat-associated core domain-containing protein [Cyclobacteriaceae bacterium]
MFLSFTSREVLLTRLYRLISNEAAGLRSYSQQYEYDELGNILQVIHQISQAGTGNWNRYYHYNAGFTKNYLLSTSTDHQQPTQDQYTYNAHGNMLQMPHLSEMGWDYADRLRSTKINAEEVVYYTYDAAGDRVRKIREKNDGGKWERLYLGDFEYYREVNAGGTIEKERTTLHVSDDTGRICLSERVTIESSTSKDLSASPYIFRYQLSNHLGSAAMELDETAQVISYEEYYPFGSTSYWTGRSESEVKQKRYRYVGKEKDGETGLYYYGARYYAAWSGRAACVGL